jgi:hypothetical protein
MYPSKVMWGLSDLYAVVVRDVLPQPERGNKSPYEFRHGKQPNVDARVNMHL